MAHLAAPTRRQLARGEVLFAPGDPFGSIYVLRVGGCKTLALTPNGEAQVTGFPMAGDVVGLDGIDTGWHPCQVVALEATEVLGLPFAECEAWARRSARAQCLLRRTLAEEIVRSQDHLLLLSAARAEQRVAIFLLDLAERMWRVHGTRSRFLLPMTRQEIGSYVGLKLETVSRVLSNFQRAGLLQVQGRAVSLLDFPALWQASGRTPGPRRPPLEPLIDRNGKLAAAKGRASRNAS